MFKFFNIFLRLLNFKEFKVIFNTLCRIIMKHDLTEKIKKLEDDILRLEENIEEFSRLKYYEGIKKTIPKIQSNLKYLSVLVNGVSIDKEEDKRIMYFLSTHYSYLKKLSSSSYSWSNYYATGFDLEYFFKTSLYSYIS